jgi:hypothetical protein
MGRPKKVVDYSKIRVNARITQDVVIQNLNEENIIMEKSIKHIIRGISKAGGISEEADPVQDIEMYVNSFLNDGYKLFATHYLGETPEVFRILYVLVRD